LADRFADLIPPDAGEPRLLFTRQSSRAIVVIEFGKSRVPHEPSPGFEVVIDAVTAMVPAFLIRSARVRAEENAARLERRPQFGEHARQCAAWHVKQRGVGENAVEAIVRKIEREEILFPHLPTVFARHRGKSRAAFQTDRRMTEAGKGPKIASRSAAQIEDRRRRISLDVLQQGGNVLADIVALSAFPEFLGSIVIMLQRAGGDAILRVRTRFHRRAGYRVRSAASIDMVERAIGENHAGRPPDPRWNKFES